jgi:hypothetical protein
MSNNLDDYIVKQSNKFINEYSDADFILDTCYKKLLKYNSGISHMFLFIVHKNNNINIVFNEGDTRKIQIIDVMTKNINLIKQKLGDLPDFFLPFYVSDTYFYFDNDFPVFVEAKPTNKKGIIYPDKDYYKVNIEKEFLNYDEFKKRIYDNGCSNLNERKEIIFFTGANTGSDKHNIRATLKEITKKDKKYEIHIAEQFIPMYKFCNYKYLLNLPGHQPWSYRMTKILLMNSLIFDVVVLQRYIKKDNTISKNTKWIQFFSNYFVNGKDYIEIEYEWTEHVTKDSEIYDKIYKKINKLFDYYQNNPSKYLSIVKSASEKANKINMNLIDKAIQHLILLFIKKIYKNNSKKDVSNFLDNLIKLNK